LIGIGAVALIALVAIVVVVATSGQKTPTTAQQTTTAPAATPSTTPATPVTASTPTTAAVTTPQATQTATAPPATTPPRAQPTPADRSAIVAVLNTYVQAWQNISPSSLGPLFTSNVTRIGSVNGSCGTTTGRAAVVNLYAASEMSSATEGYTLLNTAPSVVQFINAKAAFVGDSYTIGDSQSRYVNFHFIKQGSTWRINKIHAWCKP
jgi:hypothetical protein